MQFCHLARQATDVATAFVLRLRANITPQEWITQLLTSSAEGPTTLSCEGGITGDSRGGGVGGSDSRSSSSSSDRTDSSDRRLDAVSRGTADFDLPPSASSPIPEVGSGNRGTLRLLAAGMVICAEMRAKVQAVTGFTLSAGVASNRLLSKLVCV